MELPDLGFTVVSNSLAGAFARRALHISIEALALPLSRRRVRSRPSFGGRGVHLLDQLFPNRAVTGDRGREHFTQLLVLFGCQNELRLKSLNLRDRRWHIIRTP